jgi:hypothetical protein
MKLNYKNNTRRNNKRTLLDNYIFFVTKHPTSLPNKVDIVKYMKKIYIPFIDEKNQNNQMNKNELNLTDIFSVPPELQKPEQITSINTNLPQNNNMSLDKFIAYSLLFKSFNFFEKEQPKLGQLNMTKFKYQVGKDLARVPITVNSIPLPKNIVTFKNNTKLVDNYKTSEVDNYKTADNFNEYILQIMVNNKIVLSLNTIIKIDAIMCQDIFNSVSQLISLFVIDKVSPEYATETAATKSVDIILTEQKQYINYNFICKLIISYNKNLNPEYTCGSYSFKLKFDLKNNKFALNDFKLEYNVDKCRPNYVAEQTNNTNTANTAKGIDDNINEQYTENKLDKYKQQAYNFVDNNKPEIVAGLATTGVMSLGALYLAGILGGKRKTNKYKTNKYKTNKRKTNKRKKI